MSGDGTDSAVVEARHHEVAALVGNSLARFNRDQKAGENSDLQMVTALFGMAHRFSKGILTLCQNR